MAADVLWIVNQVVVGSLDICDGTRDEVNVAGAFRQHLLNKGVDLSNYGICFFLCLRVTRFEQDSFQHVHQR